MKTALRLAVVALTLGVVATISVDRTISRYPRLEGAREAGLAAGFPFFGVAVLTFVLAMKRRGQPDARIINSGIRELVRLLLLSGVWVFLVLLVWGL